MPNIKSAKKRVLVAEARNARNKANKSALKTAIKKFEAAAVEGNRTEAEGTYKVAVKAIDKAAAKEQRGPQEERADAEAQQDRLMHQTQRVSERMPVLLCPEGRAPCRKLATTQKDSRSAAAGVFYVLITVSSFFP